MALFSLILSLICFYFKHIPPPLFTDPNEIAQYLPVKENICEKLEFPESACPESTATPEGP